MLKKLYRLNALQIKKVLKGSAFFSYMFTVVSKPNRLPYNRYAIVISAKHAKHAVVRNFFRRRFYDFLAKNSSILSGATNTTDEKVQKTGYDRVFLIKKNIKLTKDPAVLEDFQKNLEFVGKKLTL